MHQRHAAELLRELQGRCAVNGDGRAVLDGVAACARAGLVLPQWLAAAFLRCYDEVDEARTGSWDEAFGKPYPPGTRLASIRLNPARARQVHAALWALLRQDPSTPISKVTFDQVGEMPGIGASAATVERRYRYAVQVLGLPDLVQVRRCMAQSKGESSESPTT